MSDQLEKQENELLYDVSLIGLTMDREMLYDRINLRVDIMMDQGLLEEVEGCIIEDTRLSIYSSDWV